jgi:hypothetical protein
MPRVSLIDPWSFEHRCDTRNWDTVLRWLKEWCPELGPKADQIAAYGPLRCQVMPLFDDEGKDPDWPADSRWAFEQFPVDCDPERTLQMIFAKRQQIIERLESERIGEAG